MKNHVRKFLVVAAIAAVAASIAGIALARGNGASPPTPTFSNDGQPAADLSQREAAQLQQAGIRSQVRLLGTRGGFSLFRAQSGDGGACFLTRRLDGSSSEFGVIACLPADASFPSTRSQVFDVSPLLKYPGEALPHVTALVGFAADQVVSAGVVDESGQVHTTPVSQNVYATSAFSGFRAQAIVGLDAAGREVYRHDLTS